MNPLKKISLSVFLMMGVFLLSAGSKAEEGYRPTNDGGSFGLGLMFGGAGAWGATGKIWLSRAHALQPAVEFDDGGSTVLQLDYLWHDFNIIHMRETKGEMPLYIGLGGDLILQDKAEFGGRIPVGISYIFDKRNVPVDIFLQAVPTLWFFNRDTSFKIYGELGGHYYF